MNRAPCGTASFASLSAIAAESTRATGTARASSPSFCGVRKEGRVGHRKVSAVENGASGRVTPITTGLSGTTQHSSVSGKAVRRSDAVANKRATIDHNLRVIT